MKRACVLFVALICGIPAFTAESQDTAPAAADTVSAEEKRPGFIKRIINYFANANKQNDDGGFDFSVIGGPHYSSDSKLGIGIVAAGTYRTTQDSGYTKLSNISIYGDATTAAHFKLGVRGENFFPQNKYRIVYDVAFSSIETKYWGIGYEQCHNDKNESKYRYLAARANINAYRRLGDNFYVGPMISVDYIDGRHFEHPALWEGLPLHTFNWGIGLSAAYDTRDCTTECERGVLVRLDQYFDVSWLGNRYPFSVNEFTAAAFNPLWRGATLATRLHWRMTWGDTPWGALSTIGGSDNMRGYFEGRYRDKSEIDLCVELRQHVWRRNGFVIWAGAASVFPRIGDIRFKQILPNYGIGYRWEFKQRMNVRVDLGFGRHQTGFIFNINEAF